MRVVYKFIDILIYQRCVISKSLLCNGLGLFNVELIKKDDLVIEYYGEILKLWQSFLLEILNGNSCFYTFKLTEEKNLDSMYYGNKSRFINHSKDFPNCYARVTQKKQKINSR